MAQWSLSLRIANVTSSISRIGAGVSKIVRDLAEKQDGNDRIVDILPTQIHLINHVLI